VTQLENGAFHQSQMHQLNATDATVAVLTSMPVENAVKQQQQWQEW
jgi:hypothetical protein